MIFLNFFQSTFSWGICPPTIGMRKAGWIQLEPELQIELVYLFGKGSPGNAGEDKVHVEKVATFVESLGP